MNKVFILLFAFLFLLTGCNRPSVSPDESPAEGSQTAETTAKTEAVRFGDVVIPWYLDIQLPTSPDEIPWYIEPDVPDEKKNLAVKVPLTYEAEVDGLSFQIEFFQEYYPLGSLIQARITVHNGTEKSFEYYRNSGSIGYIKGIKEGASTGINHLLITEEDQETVLELYYLKTFPKDETFVFERAFPARSKFFELGEEYKFSVSIQEMTSDLQHARSYVLSFPIEVVEIE